MCLVVVVQVVFLVVYLCVGSVLSPHVAFAPRATHMGVYMV